MYVCIEAGEAVHTHTHTTTYVCTYICTHIHTYVGVGRCFEVVVGGVGVGWGGESNEHLVT